MQKLREMPGRLAILLALVLSGCTSGDEVAGGEDPSAADLTIEGWACFDAASYAAALERFEAAQLKDGSYGSAHTGEGWARLMLAETLSEIDLARASFSAALLYGETGAEVYGGRAALGLAADFGTLTLATAISDAQAARTAEPAFVFAHLPSFDSADLWRIEAYAQAAAGDFAAALTAADAVSPSGIEQLQRSTWVVDEVPYAAFAEAVMAHLVRISEENP